MYVINPFDPVDLDSLLNGDMYRLATPEEKHQLWESMEDPEEIMG